ncbi:MAG: 2,3-bisphosphoglycerate-independent phosphoglycerate mutase [Rhodobacter sp.]|uniref:2,3-bisphosphoglycerate-independent phosphoglycerate mutase n=1 Tax=Pararhodobacter sp. TaxID=2127056 RepID=UPI001DDEECBB|nr:2,3-bisphosphoglycerate-independent phosphoglycerate mutase [Pararhodobacter sp.]MCB1344825.1 2,3-bisphosphoglycerate-independent phosphoglycerate mutase [Paracoccaceae bacterium]MCC0072116.1 2,3-bisphosphoglycerate-independent phosphoglycerate mutase [Rhodobacter sp.]HPD91613.1 2,3-bisphosphoglycerate-independent phosphoglycerate mutase [Pararhodobacter sp.]
MTRAKPVVLCILDGWGINPNPRGNAVALANTPTFDRVMATCPSATLVTYGPDVGLPTGQMGNSEVGHMNIGAGRVVAMDLGQIDLAIEDGSFYRNPALLDFAARVKAAGGTAHVIGLCSDGGVHAHSDHMMAAARALTGAGLPVAVHVITDGRDVAPTSAGKQVGDFELSLPPGARVATVSGRYYAMDRDNRWERVEKAYRTIVEGAGDALKDAADGIATCYDLNQTDEFIEPFVIDGYGGMKPGDGVFFVNFRADRAREILSAIGDPGFSGFRRQAPSLSALLGMVDYSEAHNAYMTTMFPKQVIVNTLAEWVGRHGLRQYHSAETEKYPHVTFFLNGGKETPEPGEDRYLAASPKVATYDLKPEMSAPEVTDHFVQAIGQGYDLIVVNYANPDMVGHTGVVAAGVKAVETVDRGLGRVLEALERAGGAMLLTADHGNCEMMIDYATGGPHTAHTTNPVPVALIGWPEPGVTLADGRLADVAPTLLEMMGLPQPPEMTGRSLIRRG